MTLKITVKTSIQKGFLRGLWGSVIPRFNSIAVNLLSHCIRQNLMSSMQVSKDVTGTTKARKSRVFELYQTRSKRKYSAWKAWKSAGLLKNHIPGKGVFLWGWLNSGKLLQFNLANELIHICQNLISSVHSSSLQECLQVEFGWIWAYSFLKFHKFWTERWQGSMKPKCLGAHSSYPDWQRYFQRILSIEFQTEVTAGDQIGFSGSWELILARVGSNSPKVWVAMQDFLWGADEITPCYSPLAL